MSRATPELHHFARRLIKLEANRKNTPKTRVFTAFSVTERMRPMLSMLIGNAGFRTLLARAHTLATTETPWLRVVQVNADGSLQGWEELRAQFGADEFLRGQVGLVAQLLGLLVAFIGEHLTVRLIGEIWPKLSLKELNLAKGENHEGISKNS
jgi:hypothetical protein